MKKLVFLILISIIMFTSTSCGKKDVNTDMSINTVDTSNSDAKQTEPQTVSEASIDKESETSENKTNHDVTKTDMQLLQSASIDIDADGEKEEVEVIQQKTKGTGENDHGELEGVLRITDGSYITNITFIRKQEGFTGVMTSFDFADLDGDGAIDIFVIIPDSGAAFSLNYFYAYSYKTGKSYSYTSDSNLSEFTEGFSFKYSGEGKLQMINDKYNFNAVFDISDSAGLDKDEENNIYYENSWVEPTPIEISENSRIRLIKGKDGISSIKVPLPVFGRGTVEMIGEIDLYYDMDKYFKPVLRYFEALDFGANEPKTIGRWN